MQNPGDSVSDGIVVIGQLGSLGMDDAIKVYNLITSVCDLRGGRRQHLGRVALSVGLVGIWKHLSDVAQGGRAQQGVGHGVQQNVGIAMADKLPVVRHVDAAQSQRSARRGAMRVFANADSQIRSGVSWGSAQGVTARIIPA
jgi:hypothetical protein